MRFALYAGLATDQNFGDWWLYRVIQAELQQFSLLPIDKYLNRSTAQRFACHLWGIGLLPRCGVGVLGGGTILMPTRDYLLRPLLRGSRAHFSIGTGAKSTVEREHHRFPSTEDCKRLLESYSLFRRVTVRGPLSAESLLSAGFSRPVEVVGDPFLGLYRQDRVFGSNSDRDILVNIADLGLTQARYWAPPGATIEGFYLRMLSDLLKAGYTPQMVICSPDDRRMSNALAKRLGLREPKDGLSIDQIEPLLKSVRGVVATRLHFAIFSVLRGVPTASLNYADKHLDFWQSLLPKTHFPRLSELGSRDLATECERQWDILSTNWQPIAAQIGKLNAARNRLYREIGAVLGGQPEAN